MAKKNFRITESDFLLANRKASREEELERHGKQIIFRSTIQKSKKVYDRKRLKKADIKLIDGLPLFRATLSQILVLAPSLEQSDLKPNSNLVEDCTEYHWRNNQMQEEICY